MFSRFQSERGRAALSLVIAALVSAWATIGATVGHAQSTQTWSTSPTSGDWNVAGNWTSGTAPVGNDSLAFGATTIATATNNFTAGTQFNGITFDSGAAIYTLSGNQITLGGSVTNNSTATQTFGGPGSPFDLALSTTQSFNAASGGITLSGVISGAGGLTKTGTGVLTLSGVSANTYSGTTTVSAGRLTLGKTPGVNAVAGDLAISNAIVTFTQANQIADTAAVTMSGANAVFNETSVASASTNANALNETIGSLAVTGGFVFGGGAIGLTSGFVVTGAASFDNTAGTTDFYQNSNSLTSFDSLSLVGMSSTTGVSAASAPGRFAVRGSIGQATLTVGSGGLALDNSKILLMSTSTTAGSRLVLNGDVTTTGVAASSIQAPAGETANQLRSVQLSGTTGSVTRSFTVGGGGANLSVLVPITNGSATTAGITKLGTGTLTLSGSNSYDGGTQIDAGVLALGNANALGSTGTISFGGGTLQFSTSNTTDYSSRFSTAAAQAYSLDTNGQTVTLATALTSTDGSLTKLGSGTLTVSASNSYDGGSQLNAGVLDYGHVAALGTGTVAFTGNTTLRAGVAGTVANAMSIDSGITGSFDTQANSTTLSGEISGSGAFTKLGAGSLTLSASNSFTGSTRAVDGTLNLNNASALLASTLDMNADDSGSVTFATNTTLGGLTGSRDLNLGTRVVSIGDNNQSTTYSGVLSNGSLTKTGTGVLTLSGGAANTASGATTVSAGRLALDKTAGVNAVGGDLAISNAFVTFARNNQIADTAAVTMSGSNAAFNGTGWGGIGAAGSLLSLDETLASLDVTGGVVNTNNGSASTGLTVTGAVSVTGGAGNTDFYFGSGGLGSFGSLSLVGMNGTSNNVGRENNTFRLFGNSPRQTQVTIGSGGLSLDGSTILLARGNSSNAQGSRLVLNGDVTTVGSSASRIREVAGAFGTLEVALSGSGGDVNRSFTVGGGGADLSVLVPITNGSSTGAGIRKLGVGTLTLGNANTYTGATSISAGTLALAAGGSFATSPTITVGDTDSSGAVLDLTAKTGTFTFADSQTVGGIGTIKPGTVEFAGILAPGNSPGILTFDGGTAILSGSTQIEFFGATRGTGYDAIDLNNSAAINYGNGVLALDFGSWLAAAQSYQLFGNGSQSLLGNFSDVTIAGTNYTGLTFSGSSGVWTSQGSIPSGQTLTFTEATGTLVIVPEPGALALAAVGIAAAAWARRRRG